MSTNTTDNTPDDTVSPVDYSAILDGMSADEAEQLSETTMIETPEGELPLSAMLLDIVLAHQDLDDYKNAGLTMTQALKERRYEAETAGDDTVAAFLSELEKSAFGIYVRVQRGDAEVFEEQDGEYSAYFEQDTDDEGETDATA